MNVQNTEKVVAGEFGENFHHLSFRFVIQQLGREVLTKDIKKKCNILT